MNKRIYQIQTTSSSCIQIDVPYSSSRSRDHGAEVTLVFQVVNNCHHRPCVYDRYEALKLDHLRLIVFAFPTNLPCKGSKNDIFFLSNEKKTEHQSSEEKNILMQLSPLGEIGATGV